MKLQAKANLPTDFGLFTMHAYSNDDNDQMPILVLINPETDWSKPVNVRIHSECVTGDLFGSHKCECGEQLAKAMKIATDDGGVIIYLRQEGRGIGIINKLRAYQKQELGLDTVEANEILGLPIDDRDYNDALLILKSLDIGMVNLLTNNPDKIKLFDNSGIELNQVIPLIIEAKDENFDYLHIKKTFFNHHL